VLRQFRLTFALTMQIVSGIAFCAMLGAIFWRAATMPVVSDRPPQTIADDTTSEAGALWQTRPKSMAEILLGPRGHPVGSEHGAPVTCL
jgi:hypothetical protein